MTEVDALPFCYKIPMTVELDRLKESILTFIDRLGITETEIEDWLVRHKNKTSYPINLTHLPRLKSKTSRALAYRDNHGMLQILKVDEKDFTVFMEEMSDLYLGEVVQAVYNQHSGKFQGRAQLTWLGNHRQFDFHTDPHTPNRYHIPVITNRDCYWLFRQEGHVYKLHMPADGSVWYIDPSVEHTFVNDSDFTRLHILFTSGF